MIFGRPLTTSALNKTIWRKEISMSFRRFQKASGMTFVSFGMLSHCMRALVEQADMTTFYSMRCYFQGGVAGVEIHLCLEALHRHGIFFAMIRSFAEAGWSKPVFQNTDVSQLLSDIRDHKRAADGKRIQGDVQWVFIGHTYGDAILLKLLSCSPTLPTDANSLYQLVSASQMCKALDSAPEPLIQRLAGLQRQHLQDHKAAHGEEHLKPKHHFSLRIPAQIARHGVLLDTFVLELKRKFLKQIGSDV